MHIIERANLGLICETTLRYRSLFCSQYGDLIYPDDDTTTPWVVQEYPIQREKNQFLPLLAAILDFSGR